MLHFYLAMRDAGNIVNRQCRCVRVFVHYTLCYLLYDQGF